MRQEKHMVFGQFLHFVDEPASVSDQTSGQEVGKLHKDYSMAAEVIVLIVKCK